MNETEIRIPRSEVDRSTAGSRLLIGLLQGLALYLIYQAGENKIWHAGNSGVFAPLLLVATIIPVLLISALGHVPKRTLWYWLLPAAAVLGLLGFYDIWSNAGAPYWDTPKSAEDARYPSPPLWLHAIAGLLIAHTLVIAGSASGRRMATYHVIFETASKLLIQFAFAVVFVAISWLVLHLGSELFHLIKLDFLKKLLDKPWFVIPVITFAFAYALHITDVRPAIVRGIRSLVLVLLSWILPVAVLLIGGFLLALPVTGLGALWATKSATALLLAASAVLVVLINAAYQDGESAQEVAAPIRFSARLAALLLLPLVSIAAYALSLRVGQYGWTVDRLVAGFYLLMAACFAVGYFWAALRGSPWLARVASVNVHAAFVLLALLLAIFSPLLDPARISVNSQMAQLQSGKISADAFDYEYLRFEGKRFGSDALQQLAARKTGTDVAVIARKAQAALAKDRRWQRPQATDKTALAANITAWPKGVQLPVSFLEQDWKKINEDYSMPECLRDRRAVCDVIVLDIDGDGRPELLVPGGVNATLFGQNSAGAWRRIGTIDILSRCSKHWPALKSGDFELVPSPLRDIRIGDTRYVVDRVQDTAVKVGCNKD